jgi:pilus assembly protein Flp/PilA
MDFALSLPTYVMSGMAAGVIEMTLQTIKASVLKFAKDEEGLTIVEYAVAGGLITVAVAAAFVTLGGQVNTKITALCTAVNGGAACP